MTERSRRPLGQQLVPPVEAMQHRRRYRTALGLASGRGALAELALFARGHEAYLTRAQAKERRAAEAVYLPSPARGRSAQHRLPAEILGDIVSIEGERYRKREAQQTKEATETRRRKRRS